MVRKGQRHKDHRVGGPFKENKQLSHAMLVFSHSFGLLVPDKPGRQVVTVHDSADLKNKRICPDGLVYF
jgi:hypothetical protein